MSDPQDPVAKAVRAYHEARADYDEASRQKARAETKFHQAEAALGIALTPKSAKKGERFSVWDGDTLVTVEVPAIPVGRWSIDIQAHARRTS